MIKPPGQGYRSHLLDSGKNAGREKDGASPKAGDRRSELRLGQRVFVRSVARWRVGGSDPGGAPGNNSIGRRQGCRAAGLLQRTRHDSCAPPVYSFRNHFLYMVILRLKHIAVKQINANWYFSDIPPGTGKNYARRRLSCCMKRGRWRGRHCAGSLRRCGAFTIPRNRAGREQIRWRY
jgi:hypothetical protein